MSHKLGWLENEMDIILARCASSPLSVTVFCRPEDSDEDVLRKMTERSVRHLPVVENGVLKGLLNIRGVLESRFEEADMRAEEMRKYVFGVGYH